MTIPITPLEAETKALTSIDDEKKSVCTRDRLLKAIKTGTELSVEDAEAINSAVREARESSLSDELRA